jgi:hypothetical protein
MVDNEGGKNWVLKVIAGVPEGSRHDSAVRLVGRWYGKGLCASEVILLLMRWNELNSPPLGMREIDSIFDSTLKWRREWQTPPMSAEKVNEIIRAVKKLHSKRR